MKMKQSILTLIILFACAAGVMAKDGLKTHPRYERYQHIKDLKGELVTGGTIKDVTWLEDGESFEYTIGEMRYRFDLSSKQVTEIEKPEDEDDDEKGNHRRPRRGRQRDVEPSPDGNWNAKCVDWNVILERSDELGGIITVTTTGTRKHRFGKASWVYGEELRQIDAMFWSPDSKKLAYFELDETAVKDFHLIGELNTIRTEAMIEGYPKPGEPNPIAYLWIYDLESSESIRVDVGDDTEQYVYRVRFSPNGDALLFNRTNRHQNHLELVAADPDTGVTRVVVTETQDTWQNNSPEIRFLEDGHRFIWETERSGFKQYELRDLDGTLIQTLSTGHYPANAIARVDEARDTLYYTAYSDENPLFVHLHSIKLDGSDPKRLTATGVSHTVQFSDDGKWFISRIETIELPPQTVLFDASGNEIHTLAVSDTSLAETEGITPPEQIVFKAADGVTDLYGVVYKPSHFDPDRSYPLVLDVYGGPLSKRVRARYRAAYPETEFGLCIVVIDNRGTTGRGKAFESAIYLKLGEVDIADQVLGVQHLTKRPYLDAERVGVFGHSYGGYMSALAITKYPEIFHTAVAGGTVADWRQYDTIYTERFMRTPQENLEGYDAGSVLTYIEQLRGNLLLLHGMIDDNVHPTNAWQIADALQKADKSFEMMMYPTSAHGLGAHARNLRWEFLVEHLLDDRVYSSGLERIPSASD